jgi:hypothetical protein
MRKILLNDGNALIPVNAFVSFYSSSGRATIQRAASVLIHVNCFFVV